MESAQSFFLLSLIQLFHNKHEMILISQEMEKTIVGRKQTLKEDRHYAAKMIECSNATGAQHKRDVTELLIVKVVNLGSDTFSNPIFQKDLQNQPS